MNTTGQLLETLTRSDLLRKPRDRTPISAAAQAHRLRCSLGQRPLRAASRVRASPLHPWRSPSSVFYPADSSVFQSYERAFPEALGLPVAMRPIETGQLPFHRRPRENGWCALMAERSGTCSACLQTQARLAQSAADRPCTITCAYGLCETAVPVKLGNETVALLQSGQVLRQKPTEASFDRAMATAASLGASLDSAKAREAYFGTPVLSPKKLDSVTRLLSTFAEHLSLTSNQIALRMASTEPPIITRAKQFIHEHYAGGKRRRPT